MSKFAFDGSYFVTVEDVDNLPEGVTQDDVFESLTKALQAAADQWYAAHSNLVRSEPVVGSG